MGNYVLAIQALAPGTEINIHASGRGLFFPVSSVKLEVENEFRSLAPGEITPFYENSGRYNNVTTLSTQIVVLERRQPDVIAVAAPRNAHDRIVRKRQAGRQRNK